MSSYSRRYLYVGMLLTCLGWGRPWPCAASPQQPAAAADVSDPTDRREPLELAIANSIPDGGGYEWKNSTGTPRTLRHAGQVVLDKQPRGTYCCGFTFAVAFETLDRRGLLKDKSFAEVKQFQKHWYGVPPATGDDAEKQAVGERQCALAVERLGIGREVKRLEDARPGDFVQLWRVNKSGHSVLLVELLHEGDDPAGRVIGLKYRSSQQLTDGVGDRVEYFADAPGREGKLDRQRTYIARLNEARKAPGESQGVN